MSIRLYKTGTLREQASLLPARMEDYVAADNPVRAIEAYVRSLDLAALGFRHGDRGGSAGQPPYDPADLLKLYLYGYLHRVRSSRALERETRRNLEVMWLLKGVTPGYRTIGNFRCVNWAGLKAANREFVLLLRSLDLVGGELVAIDGAFFDGDASKASITTQKKLAAQVVALERDIEAHGAALATNDAADEADDAASGDPSGATMAAKLAALVERRAEVTAALDRLASRGETQLSRTDADARLLSKRGQIVAGYNVQIAVDAKHKLIVASEVVNDGNDTGQLHAVAEAAKHAVGGETLTAVADTGYYNGETLRACEADGITAYVPSARHGDRLAAQDRFNHEAFRYDAAADAYVCPAGAPLKPMNGHKVDATGKRYRLYVSRRSACAACPLRHRCLTAKAKRRTIYRWEHEDVIERHRARMAGADAAPLLRRRAELAEHPFGTLKCRAGYRHFLLRGFAKVRGEWSLMALCYNFTRVLSIIGIDKFIAWLGLSAANGWILPLHAATAAWARATTAIASVCAAITQYQLTQPKMLPSAP